MPQRVIASTLILALALIAAPALAQQGGQAPQPGAAQQQQQPDPREQEFMQARQRLQQLQQELGQIQRQAVEGSEVLLQQQEELQKLIADTMEENGFDARARWDELNAMVEELQSGELAEEAQQEMVQEFRSKQQAFQQAQQQALSTEAVQQAARDFQQDTLEAMKKLDPKTDQLIADIREQQQTMQRIFQSIQQERQQSSTGG
ncbi:hypothetical protein [Alkalilimnicola sp. S0819]|uniref:hypothetical protein n=1 Tax=Alkalilimnicola sp. S0819 TaxID=2613922 RepID=UPI0012621C2A|nr:hypothetical protein [Alkalilimnicola sp. S0819]KAB7627808.1 hypothetical protein F3N43_02190 [Alkalilimnicola sp. S0819]MPQ15438.1 hypothetical protein [Alkalilimnicola sp. S0819]